MGRRPIVRIFCVVALVFFVGIFALVGWQTFRMVKDGVAWDRKQKGYVMRGSPEFAGKLMRNKIILLFLFPLYAVTFYARSKRGLS